MIARLKKTCYDCLLKNKRSRLYSISLIINIRLVQETAYKYKLITMVIAYIHASTKSRIHCRANVLGHLFIFNEPVVEYYLYKNIKN